METLAVNKDRAIKSIIELYEKADDATYGLVEMLLVGGVGSLLAIGWYFVLATITYGYVQLFSLFTGAI